MNEEIMELIVHPGIGDLSWIFSKLSTTGRKFDLVIAEDKKTRRSMPLVDMVECVNSASYGGSELYQLLSTAKNSTFQDYIDAWEVGKQLVMSCNFWVDAGNRLEGYLYDLNTDFHYDIHGSDKDAEWAEKTINKDAPSFGIYTSSIGGIRNWNGWAELEWVQFADIVRSHYPIVEFYLIGAKWDLDMREPMLKAFDSRHIEYHDLFGKTSLGQALELLRRLDYFSGFASGLTILSNVVNKPVVMFYPKILTRLMHSWPCPISIADGSYQGMVWDRPIEVFNKIKPQLDKWLMK